MCPVLYRRVERPGAIFLSLLLFCFGFFYYRGGALLPILAGVSFSSRGAAQRWRCGAAVEVLALVFQFSAGIRVAFDRKLLLEGL